MRQPKLLSHFLQIECQCAEFFCHFYGLFASYHGASPCYALPAVSKVLGHSELGYFVCECVRACCFTARVLAWAFAAHVCMLRGVRGGWRARVCVCGCVHAYVNGFAARVHVNVCRFTCARARGRAHVSGSAARVNVCVCVCRFTRTL